MTGQTLLDTMEVLDQEFQLQTSEADVVRGLIALNRAQDFFETLAAKEGKILGDTTATVTSSTSTETTAFPTGFIRLDRIQFIDPTTSLPTYDLDNLDHTGSHIANSRWPLQLFTSSNPGTPDAYYTNGRLIYWSPLPDATHTFRVYGFKHADDITASGTFSYDDGLCLPMASFAVKLLRMGVDDAVGTLDALAKECFDEAIAGMRSVVRDGPGSFFYTRYHGT